MSLCDDAGDTNINVKNDDHWNEEGKHCGKYYVADVFIVAAYLAFVPARFVPAKK